MINQIISQSQHILVSPWKNQEGLWLVLPLILVLILISLYFGRNRTEELGWNTAFGNSISLLWICILIAKFIYNQYTIADFVISPILLDHLILLICLLIWVIILLAFNFFHLVPKWISFATSSSKSVYILAYIVIAFIVGGIKLNKINIISAICVFALIEIIFYILKFITPISAQSKSNLKSKKKKDKKQKAAKKATTRKKIKSTYKKIKKLVKQKI